MLTTTASKACCCSSSARAEARRRATSSPSVPGPLAQAAPELIEALRGDEHEERAVQRLAERAGTLHVDLEQHV